MIVEKELSFDEVKTGIGISLGLSIIVCMLLLSIVHTSIPVMLVTCLILYVAAIGYTVPPLKFSYRGLGELDVAFTHSLAVILCGYIFQGGSYSDSLPWLISLPLFLAVLPSIILAGIPDYDADRTSFKKTLVVRSGKKTAATIAIVTTLAAALSIILLKEPNLAGRAYSNLVYAIIPHAILLCYRINGYIRNPSAPARIDSLMVLSLTYFVWFGLIPLINLSYSAISIGMNNFTETIETIIFRHGK